MPVSWTAEGFTPPREAALHLAVVGMDLLPLAETVWKFRHYSRHNHKRVVFNKMLVPENTDRLFF